MTTPARLSARARLSALALSVLATVLVTPAAAHADAPVTWETEEGLDWLGYLLLIVGIPAGIAIVLALFSLALHRNNFTPAEPGNEIHVATGAVDHH